LVETGMPGAAKLLAITEHFFDAAVAPAERAPALEATVDLSVRESDT
jgi:hypothetical protein